MERIQKEKKKEDQQRHQHTLIGVLTRMVGIEGEEVECLDTTRWLTGTCGGDEGS